MNLFNSCENVCGEDSVGEYFQVISPMRYVRIWADMGYNKGNMNFDWDLP